MNTFNEIINSAISTGPTTIAVAVSEDLAVLKAVEEARKLGVIEGILVGNSEKILELMKLNSIDPDNYDILNSDSNEEACLLAVEQVKNGNAKILMKGKVDTSVILKAVLNKEKGINCGGLISHVGVLKTSINKRLLLISDSAVNIYPELDDMVKIINNSVTVANALGNSSPKVAIICPVEKVNKNIPSTIIASRLTEMNMNGEIKNCIVGGPFGLDNAISEDAAKSKGINHPVAGQADILITPNLEVGNVLNKSIEYFGKAEKAGIIMGLEVPIILTSRASSSITKLNSIALAIVVSNYISTQIK